MALLAEEHAGLDVYPCWFMYPAVMLLTEMTGDDMDDDSPLCALVLLHRAYGSWHICDEHALQDGQRRCCYQRMMEGRTE